MSNELAAGKILELLDTLKASVQADASKGDKLTNDFRARTVKERQRAEAAIGEENRRLGAALAEAETTFQTSRTATLANYEARKTRIGAAYQSSKHRGLRTIDDQVGALKYELQKRMLQRDRDREAGLAAAADAFTQFREKLAATEERLRSLETAVAAAFRGYGRFVRGYAKALEQCSLDNTRTEDQHYSEIVQMLEESERGLKQYHGHFITRLFRVLPLWVVLVLLEFGLVPVLQGFGVAGLTFGRASAAVAASLAALAALRLMAQRSAAPAAAALARTMARARKLHDAAFEQSEVRRQREVLRLENDFKEATQNADRELKAATVKAGERRVSCRMEMDERAVRATTQMERNHATRLERLDREYAGLLQTLRQGAEARVKALNAASEAKQRSLTAEHETAWKALEQEWKEKLTPVFAQLQAANERTGGLFPEWTAEIWKNWAPPAEFARTAKIGSLKVDVAGLCENAPRSARLALPGPEKFTAPLCLAYPEQGSILFETGPTGHDQAIATLNNAILRLLSVAPAGRLNFTILDPVGLGQNFAGIMHLADYEEQIINNRIWTQSGQIEEKLAELNEHMEKVIQMYLRNEYATIAEYNEQAGVIAEKYHFLVVADFPANFSDVAAKRLLSIAASGARCGVYMLIHWDHRQAALQDFIPDDLRKNCLRLAAKGAGFVLADRQTPGIELALDAPPPPESAIDFVQQVGRASRDSSRVEVPFSHVAPPEDQIWTEDTTRELSVPIGRTGATKLQYLAIGRGTCQHGLLAGKTGSGKSTLFHVIITNLALWCGPEQVEFYLVDFKKGVEFKCYGARRLPHARVVAIESDREFGLSVLQRVDEELKRRGDLFRKLGVQDVAGYKKAGGAEPIPRSLLLIDEFQEFFVEDDKIGQTAALLLDRIVRQGRAFGIHVLLGSQTLGGAYTVARTTLGQMVIRIALQCNEADASLIMDETNPAPRLLSRPGEGIYNDMAGALEGNSPFQVVWLPDDERDAALLKVRARADRLSTAYPGPIVFEGNAPADVRENAPLRELLEAPAIKPVHAARVWLGAPNSIKGPTEALFQRQSGNNLLIVGQRDEAALGMICAGLLALAAQFPRGGARLILCDSSAPGSPERDYIERTLRAIPHAVTLAKPGDLIEVMGGLAAELKSRAEAPDAESAPPVFLLIHGLQKFGRLRQEDDLSFASEDPGAEANPASVLNKLLSEGTRLGFHVMATCDTYNNVNRFLSRKALSEFEMRVLFQMSANDSASLIDSPRAGNLGLHRAIFFNAQEGYLETFRPYALPGEEWVDGAGANLRRLLA